ncbi:MAG: CBS domain-containing protein [Clostridiales bacterium]|nr:CBS domain-containing protein [Clostridiales bacterium]
MSSNISCVKENTSLLQAAKQMRVENVGSLPVCDDKGMIRGIVTDRDIVIRALAKDISLATLCCSDIMSTAPTTISPNVNIHQASLIFAAKQIRRLPVVENSKLVGMLSLGDIASKPVYIDEAGDALNAISINPVLR